MTTRLQTTFRLVTVAALGVAITVPQVYVLLRPSSSRYCSQPLLLNLICSIGFTLFTTGFSLLFILVDQVPGWLRGLFHAFGAASFIQGTGTALMTCLAADCATSTPPLYHLSVVLSILSILSIGFFLMLVPFWISNCLFRGLTLDRPSRTGACYEPVTCCPCFWHV